MNAEQRILQERENWRKDRPFGFVAKPQMNPDKTLNLFKWVCTVPGPEGSPFENHNLSLVVDFFSTYPVTPPQVKFTTKVFHPNVYVDGFICLDILNEAWASSMNIKTILLSIQALLGEPNNDSPANEEAAKMYSRNPAKYMQRVARDLKSKK